MSIGKSTAPLLLFDTNVLLDVVLAREPWAIDGAQLLNAVHQQRASGAMAGHAVTTIHYVVERAAGRTAANTAVADLLSLLSVVALHDADFQRALALDLRDFEDAVQVSAALKIGASAIVTRNARDFKGAPIVLQSPRSMLAALDALDHP